MRRVYRPIAGCHPGFTLLELLVVIGIIGLLVAVLLPAIQNTRESARRTACQNNLRQWGLAFQGYAVSSQAFPVGYRFSSPSQTFVAPLLPHLEQANLQYDLASDWTAPINRAAIQTRLAVLLCPSAPRSRGGDPAVIELGAAPGDYTCTHGVNHEYCEMVGWPAYDPPDQNGALTESRRPLSSIRDGLSCTFLLVEDAGRPQLWRMGHLAAGTATNASWADPNFELALDGADRLLTGGGQKQGPCVMNCTNDNEVYSFHAAGANVVMADAAVHFMHENIQPSLFAALTTRAARDVVAGF